MASSSLGMRSSARISFASKHADRLLFCENETQFRSTVRRQAAPGLFQGCIPRIRRSQPRRSGEPCRRRHQGRWTLRARDPGPAAAHDSRAALRPVQRRADGFTGFDAIFAQRIAEADAFYAALQKDIADEDMRRIQRQAFAGMLWSKQFYDFDVREWLDGDPLSRRRPETRSTAATAIGVTRWPPTSCRCRTSGNIPGSRPGTSPSIASRFH